MVGDPAAIPDAQAEAQMVIDAAEGRHRSSVSNATPSCRRAANAYAIVFDGNVALRKGAGVGTQPTEAT